MANVARLQLDQVERRDCDIASVQLGISRDRISSQDRLIDDLGCESLDLVELFMEIEEAFPADRGPVGIRRPRRLLSEVPMGRSSAG
jgi:acyl carrier protein